MKLTSDSETLAENKVLILYILNSVKEALTNNNLYKIVLAVVDMNYFYFQQFLLDLLEIKYIISFEKEGKQVYQITQKGIETLELTHDILPGIIKLKADMTFENELKETKEQESITAEYTPESENHYTVTCKINENNNCIFQISVFAGSREEAKKIVDNWKENAYRIYPQILNDLNS